MNLSSQIDHNLGLQLAKVIQATGPVSIADYMRQCLTHPSLGYYSSQTVFGSRGDFITSPEISQMFGELVCISLILRWQAIGKPEHISLVEFGPGRATLMCDLLRAARKFPTFLSAIESVHLLESSQRLQRLQAARLCTKTGSSIAEGSAGSSSSSIPSCKSDAGPWIHWYSDLVLFPSDLQNPFCIAHEFFDALPINAFEMTQGGWREVLVDINRPSTSSSDHDHSSEQEFCLTLSKNATTRSVSMTQGPRFSSLPLGSRVEVCIEAQSCIDKLINLIMGHQATDGGYALIFDYGPATTIPFDSIRGIQDHKFVSPWLQPGKADLSVDVDFTALATQARSRNAFAYGPVTQREWLHGLGIEPRAQILKDRAINDEARRRIDMEHHRLVDATQMGTIYKVLAISSDAKVPVGFENN